MPKKYQQKRFQITEDMVALRRALSYPEIVLYWENNIIGAPNTQKRYLYALGTMRNELGDLNNVTEQQLRNYLTSIYNDEDKSASYYNIFLAVARNFFYYHLKRGFPHPDDKNYVVAQTEPDKGVFSHKAMASLFSVISKDTNASLWLVVFGLCSFGLRVGEACHLYIKDINFVDGIIQIVRTKHYCPKRWSPKRERYIKISSQMIEYINKWLDVRKEIVIDKDYEPLLVIDNRIVKRKGRGKSTEHSNRYGKSLKEYEVQRVFKKFLKEAKLSHDMHPHQLRATFITSMLDKGTPPHELIISTGHASTRSLDVYIRISNKRDRVKNMPDNILPSI